MDPLSVLRDFACRGELDRVAQSGDELRFGSAYAFPCSAETAYRSKQGHRYTLETLLFFVRHHHLRHTEYLQAARPFKIPTVTLPDRKPLLDYLLGRTASADQIDPFPPAAPATGDLSGDPSAAAVEEYRPDDPSFLSSSAAAAAAAEDDPSLLLPPYPDDALAAADGGSIAGPRVPVDLDYVAMIRSLERPLKDREALLESKNRDFYGVLVASTKREEERQRIESQQRKDGLVAKTRLIGTDDHHHRGGGGGDDHAGAAVPVPKPKLQQLLKGSKIGEGVPIILVPSASQTLITIYNVKEFLEDGVFVPSETKARTMRGARPECVTVQKKLSRDRVVAAYEVRDKPSAFKAEDWERVVAVFVLGKEWQFKDWPFKDHVEIFNKIIGFFVRFEDDSVESAKMVKQWNVKIISISKNERHQDRAAALEVWDRLEEFMRSRSHS